MTVFIFVGILLLVVIGHEFGHFIVAKWCGVKVEEFGFGFPPKIFGYRPKKNGTEYSMNALPIGGFVRLYGEEGEYSQDPQSFASKSPFQKIAILSAGVMVNIIIAIIAFTGIGIMGSTVLISEQERDSVTNPHVLITSVFSNSPAELSGLRFGDKIIAVEGSQIDSVDQLLDAIDTNRGEEVTFIIARGDEQFDAQVLARENPPEGEGSVGIALSLAGTRQVTLWNAIVGAFERIATIITMTFVVAWQGILSVFGQAELPAEAEITGPVGLVQVVGSFRQLGLEYLVTLVGLISTSLALFNILPIPALDGGRIVFVLIEMIKGSPVSQEIETKIHMTGYLILLGLMGIVTARDIMNLFG